MDNLVLEKTDVLEKPIEGFRLHALDGLRGWASLAVASQHLIVLPLANYVPEITHPVFLAFTNGELAVSIFFVMSGLALSIPFWKSATYTTVARQIFARYLRLTIPILAACLIVNSSVGLFGNSAPEAAKVLRSPQYAMFNSQLMPLSKIVVYSTVIVYIKPFLFAPIPFLWTMRTEMAGSFILFATLIIGLRSSRPRFCLLAVAIVASIFHLYVVTFLVGALIGYALIKTKNLAKATGNPSSHIYALCAITVILLYQYAKINGYTGILANAIFATLVIILMLKSSVMDKFLSNKISTFLGSVSFPLYLIHYSVFATVLPIAILKLRVADLLTPLTATILAASGLIVSILLATAFMPIERFAIVTSRRFASFAVQKARPLLSALDGSLR